MPENVQFYGTSSRSVPCPVISSSSADPSRQQPVEGRGRLQQDMINSTSILVI